MQRQQTSQQTPMKDDHGSKTFDAVRTSVRRLLAASDWLEGAWDKLNRLTETNYELGLKMAREGRIDDAILRFRVTLWIAPNHEPSLYNLACLYQHKGLQQKALTLLTRIIKQHPNHTDAIYRVATINPEMLKPEMRPSSVPTLQLLEYFENFAPYYDRSRQEEIYRLPATLHQLLRPALGGDISQQTLLDIGCGTGLCGAYFAEEFASKTGVDLSPKMLNLAYGRIDRRGVKIYNQLVRDDIRHYLAQNKPPMFDVAIAMSVLPYIGDLTLLSEQLGRVINPGGMVALNFAPYPETNSYGVLPATGYFGHGLGYVDRLFAVQGFETVRTGEVESSAGTFSQLCFFRKNDTFAL